MFRKLIVIIVCFILAGCIAPLIKGGRGDGSEVTFWTLQMNDFAPYMNSVIAEFEAQNPGMKIKWVDVPFSEGEKRTLAAILSDNPPDLINLNPDFSALLAQRGALQEIDPTQTGQFNQEILNTLKYNDKLYSLPWYATSAVTIYNKKLLASLSVPKTYEDLGKIAPVIRQKTGAYAFMPNLTENDTMPRILNKYPKDKEDAVFDYFRKLYKEDLIPKESITQTQREALEKYMSGQIVFLQAGPNFLLQIKENAPATYAETDVAPQITGELGQNDFSLMNLVIPSRARHKEEALKFALFLTNEKNQLELAKLTNILAVNQKALQDEFYTKYDDLPSKARVISAKQLNKVNPVFLPARNQKEINTQINLKIQKLLLD
ncbi:MAG: sugar ABC transporter substrate-binding protein [Heliobacteriaceae bacterium]|jgi:putative chitobiose transport system substrate-binding protein|nr:sugar ABC transporter substrate-binding protein [Heliobacteriaceae bacterium]